MAIDYGTKRVGLAVTDPLRITANGLDTVAAAEAIGYIARYAQKEPIDLFIVGLPRQMNYQESENMRHIKPFLEKLKKQFPDKEIVMMDERFTSVLAHRAMIDAGLKRKDRQNKALVDKISATIILQSYLETNNR